MHYTWFCQKCCCQYITDYRNYGMYDILHVFVKIWSSIKGCIIMKKTFFASQLNMVSNFKEISWDKLNNISYLDFGYKLGISDITYVSTYMKRVSPHISKLCDCGLHVFVKRGQITNAICPHEYHHN